MMINGTTSSTIISLDQTMSIISMSFANVIIYLLISINDQIKGSRKERCWSVTPTIFYFFPLWYPVGTQRVSWGFIIYIWQLLQFLRCKALGGVHYGNRAHAQARAQLGLTGPYFVKNPSPGALPYTKSCIRNALFSRIPKGAPCEFKTTTCKAWLWSMIPIHLSLLGWCFSIQYFKEKPPICG